LRVIKTEVNRLLKKDRYLRDTYIPLFLVQLFRKSKHKPQSAMAATNNVKYFSIF